MFVTRMCQPAKRSARLLDVRSFALASVLILRRRFSVSFNDEIENEFLVLAKGSCVMTDGALGGRSGQEPEGIASHTPKSSTASPITVN
jgi:hypothetical protein